MHSHAPRMLSFPSCLLSQNVKTAHSRYYKRFVGRVLLELSKLSLCAFSQSEKSIFHVRCQWWCFLRPFRRNKGQIFQPIAQAWHRNEAPKSAFLFGSSTYRLQRYRCLIGTGLQYPTLVVQLSHLPVVQQFGKHLICVSRMKVLQIWNAEFGMKQNKTLTGYQIAT